MDTQEHYRQCAAVMVLRKSGSTTQFLLLHKPRANDAWQLPQGGIEARESVLIAALRELQEEAGIEALPLGESTLEYQYDFPDSFRSYRPDSVKGQHVSFVYAACMAAKVVVDEDEIDDSTWITIEQLPEFVTRTEYKDIVGQVFAEASSAYEQYLLVNS